ncbi:hypothetical protein [Acididesulfobacillus acetoxydans]|nr:hypothetical protein [Acididesulfobacillus acetoxydans]
MNKRMTEYVNEQVNEKNTLSPPGWGETGNAGSRTAGAGSRASGQMAAQVRAGRRQRELDTNGPETGELDTSVRRRRMKGEVKWL